MKFKLFVLVLVLVLGFVVGVYGTYKFMGARIAGKEKNIHITSTVEEILPISEYAALVYHYSDVITHSDVHKLFGKDVPFTTKKAIYTIEGTVKLGFNGKDITISGSPYNDIVLHMPKVEILSHEIYPETFNLYDEKTGLFNSYSFKNVNEIQMEHKIERERKVNENSDLFRQAQKSAEQQFRTLLENLPGIKGVYQIDFEWDDSWKVEQ